MSEDFLIHSIVLIFGIILLLSILYKIYILHVETEKIVKIKIYLKIIKSMHMTPEETLEHWRKELSCEAQVKRQLLEEFANAETEEEIQFLNKILELIYKPNN
jgi:hypothetical protein